MAYDAYRKGHFSKWENLFNKLGRVTGRLDFNELDPARRTHLEGKQDRLTNKVKRLGKKVDNDPIAELDMREVERQGDVRYGRKAIDQNFKQFNNGYFDDYRQDYEDFYNPQIEEQFGDARGKLIAALAGRGTLESTAGFGKIADLQKEKDLAATTVANDAIGAANNLRGDVEAARANLYSMNEAAADPKSMNAMAKGQATALVAPPRFNPLGQVFANFLAPMNFSNLNLGRRAGYSSIYPSQAAGGGSGTVIGG